MHTHEPKNPRIVLEEDHRHLDVLLDRLLVQVRADDRAAALKAWQRVESVTLAHFDAEEMFLFPALMDAEPVEVKRLVAEHAEIRRTLGELGLAFELHTCRAEAVEQLCAALREHAAREQALLYLLAERRLHVSASRALFDRLRGAASVLVKGATSRAKRRGAAGIAT